MALVWNYRIILFKIFIEKVKTDADHTCCFDVTPFPYVNNRYLRATLAEEGEKFILPSSLG